MGMRPWNSESYSPRILRLGDQYLAEDKGFGIECIKGGEIHAHVLLVWCFLHEDNIGWEGWVFYFYDEADTC